MTHDSNSQKSMVTYNSDSLMPLAYQQLDTMMARYNIPESELKDNKALLEGEKEKDQQRHQKSLETAITKYQSDNGRFVRFLNRLKNWGKAYVPSIPETEPSPETDLFASLVDMQEAVSRGYDLLSGLPKVVKHMSEDYTSLDSRERELARQIRQTKTLMEDIPARIDSYRKAREDLANYQYLDEDSKKGLQDLLAENDEIPPIVIPDVRVVYITNIDNCLDQLQRNSLGSKSTLQLAEDELAQIQQERTLLTHQYDELKEGWRPAVNALHKLKMQYDKLKRFAPSARLAIGMNNLREDTVTLIADSEKTIANAVCAIEDSKQNAKLAEDVDEEVRGLLKSG
jgi:chromosome segregation ATPase